MNRNGFERSYAFNGFEDKTVIFEKASLRKKIIDYVRENVPSGTKVSAVYVAQSIRQNPAIVGEEMKMIAKHGIFEKFGEKDYSLNPKYNKNN